ncbi:GH3 auxin-responsive promoter family protein [Candidatus Bathyarchaeota archaeon]|nr:GH3 auxin-responsive promoter family protein [Candidatus Bathyarchaeota archaeon]
MSENPIVRINKNLESWYESINDPNSAQLNVLNKLINIYKKTDYGILNNIDSIDSIEDYQKNFKELKYNELELWLQKIREENYKIFLHEAPLTWVMTRGTTSKSKIIPVTPTHLQDLIKCGSRAVLNYSMNKGGLNLLSGNVLNLQFPSNISKLRVGGKEVVCGFSSGTYAKLNPMMMGLGLIPRQEEIDALQTDLTRKGWETRYEYIFHKSKDKQIVSIIGVAPVQTGFARYIKKKHNIYPKDVWDLKVIYTTSVAKIHSYYAEILKKMYGDLPIIEMYTATEGAFAQQIDGLPYIVPNYDTYLFEVKSGSKYKMLHQMKRGEWGKLIISTSMLPRYEIGDLIEAFGKNYYRVFGRDNFLVNIEHRLFKMFFGWFL